MVETQADTGERAFSETLRHAEAIHYVSLRTQHLNTGHNAPRRELHVPWERDIRGPFSTSVCHAGRLVAIEARDRTQVLHETRRAHTTPRSRSCAR
jgi:hypothetical protein